MGDRQLNIVAVSAGGGAAGAVPFGAEKAFNDAGIRFTRGVGTSIGGINRLAISFGGYEATEELWRSVKSQSDVFTFKIGTIFFQARGIHNASPLRKKVQRMYDRRPFSPTPFETTAVDLITKEVRYTAWDHPDVVNMTVAGGSIPLFAEPYVQTDKEGRIIHAWQDGGLRENVPLRRALSYSPDIVVVFHCFPSGFSADDWKVGNFTHNGARGLEIVLAEREDGDLACPPDGGPPVFHVRPDKTVLNVLDFDPKKIDAGIDYGYRLAQPTIDAVRKAIEDIR